MTRILLAFLVLAVLVHAETRFDLIPSRPGARSGSMHIAGAKEGLVVRGEIGGGPPDFAKTAAAMPQKDHVEIWVAASSDPELPEIGWGNQFGMMTCKGEELTDEAKKACPKFTRDMTAYRRQFRRLFVRQFQLAPDIAAETFATPAYNDIATRYAKQAADQLVGMKPSGLPNFTAQPSATGYSFTAVVPWSALPPVNALKLEKLRVMVDVFSATTGAASSQPYSTTSSTRKYGDPATFTAVQLDAPMAFDITTCRYDLKTSDIYADEHPAWFFPNATGTLNVTFSIQNSARGYQYEPEGLSPGVVFTHYFEKQAAPGATICGPSLALAANGKIERSDFEVDEKNVETRALPDGSLLIKSGPTESTKSAFGSGACGSCPVISFSVYKAPASGAITEAFEIAEVLGESAESPTELRVSLDSTLR